MCAGASHCMQQPIVCYDRHGEFTCVYVCMYVCMYVCTFAGNKGTFGCVLVLAIACSSPLFVMIGTVSSLCVLVCVCMYVYVCICMCVCVYIYIYIYIYVHTYIYTCMYTLFLGVCCASHCCSSPLFVTIGTVSSLVCIRVRVCVCRCMYI